MRTNLDREITTPQQAKTFLSDLSIANELYHPEDDAHDIVNGRTGERSFSDEDADKLNELMDKVYEVAKGNFDPCGYILDELESWK